MRNTLLILLLSTIVIPAAADPDELSGGVLIAHHPPSIAYSEDQDWCAAYFTDYAITDASQQVPRTDVVSSHDSPDTWYIIAAFPEDKEWCGVQFGFGPYNEDVFYMRGFSVEYCVDNVISIPYLGWPGPYSGISIVATGASWEGNYLPVCCLHGYTYLAYQHSDYMSTIVPIIPHMDGGCLCVQNCNAPGEVWYARGGGLGVFTDGFSVYPGEEETPSVCCTWDGICTIELPDDCWGMVYPHDSCDPNPCQDAPTAIQKESWGTIKTLYR
jgi:hypothetical protein